MRGLPVTARVNTFSVSDPSNPDELFTGLYKGARSDQCLWVLEFLLFLARTERSECRLPPTQRVTSALEKIRNTFK